MTKKMVSYAHRSDSGGIRFIQYENDTIPPWAVDVQPHVPESPTVTFELTLNDREKQLITGMIEVHFDHANRCDKIINRVMADKQKHWDMERVNLLEKILKASEVPYR